MDPPRPPLEAYRFLVRRGGPDDGPAADRRCVEEDYAVSDLVGGKAVVVRDEHDELYRVFPTRAAFADWAAARPPSRRCFHEVVFGQSAQRLKFDIDVGPGKADALPDPPAPAAGIAELLEALGCAEPAADSARPTAASARSTAKVAAAMNVIIDAVLEELWETYAVLGGADIRPSRRDLLVMTSSGPAAAPGTAPAAAPAAAPYKHSYHVLVMPYAVVDCHEAREFTARVLARLPPAVAKIVDPGVNKQIQCFRMLGSAKPGSGRVKRPTAEFGTASLGDFADCADGAAAGAAVHALVTAEPGMRVLPRVFETGRRAPAERAALAQEAVSEALALAERLGLTDGHALRDVRGGLLSFDRQRPTPCRVCGETHHRDNSLMLLVAEAEAGAWPAAAAPAQTGRAQYHLTEMCRQKPGVTINHGVFAVAGVARRGARAPPPVAGPAAGHPPGAAPAAAPGAGPPPKRDPVADRLRAIAEGRVDPHAALASRFEGGDHPRTVYAEPQMRDYELVPTLAVAAQMKLGKTKALRRYITRYFPQDPEALQPAAVRFVTFRQTFSGSIKEAFPDFELYSDLKGDLDRYQHPRLIVQVESLHRLRMRANPEPIDLLVLDEVESILAQFNSGLHRNHGAAFAVFAWMLRTARHVVCMDANLSDRTWNTLARMRPDAPPHFHWNQEPRARGDVYEFTTRQDDWLEALYGALRAGKRIVLPTNSLAEAKAFAAGARAEFPDKRVALYSSETLASEKAAHFGDVHTHWKGLDLLIYTPTCSAGVSFELEWYDCLFGYFSDGSCDVETCRQMLGRVRNLRERRHVVCLRATGASLPATPDAVKKAIYDRRSDLYRDESAGGLEFRYGDDGRIEYYESDFFHLWAETKAVEHLSRNRFIARFIDQVVDTGAAAAPLAPTGTGAGAALLCGHRELKSEQRRGHADAVAAAPPLSAEEAEEIRERMSGTEDVLPEDRLRLQQYRLRENYGWQGRPLSGDFVLKYDRPAPLHIYRALRAVTSEASCLKSLMAIRAQELDLYEAALAARRRPPARGAWFDAASAAEGADLRRNYTYQQHWLAFNALRLCGWACITDSRRIPEPELVGALSPRVGLIDSLQDRIISAFPHATLRRVRLDAGAALKDWLKVLNAPLALQYGLRIARAPRRQWAAPGEPAYFLDRTADGLLFVFSPDPEPDLVEWGARPHIPSRLEPLPPPRNNDYLDPSAVGRYSPDERCFICWGSPPVEPVKVEGRHLYCRGCIDTWWLQSLSNPATGLPVRKKYIACEPCGTDCGADSGAGSGAGPDCGAPPDCGAALSPRP